MRLGAFARKEGASCSLAEPAKDAKGKISLFPAERAENKILQLYGLRS